MSHFEKANNTSAVGVKDVVLCGCTPRSPLSWRFVEVLGIPRRHWCLWDVLESVRRAQTCGDETSITTLGCKLDRLVVVVTGLRPSARDVEFSLHVRNRQVPECLSRNTLQRYSRVDVSTPFHSVTFELINACGLIELVVGTQTPWRGVILTWSRGRSPRNVAP